jgi:phosphoadenylyl-sulfate reductase (thioredoxin)
MVMQIDRSVPILTIDTGRIPPSTNRAIQAVERRYGIVVERIVPDPAEVDAMVELHGRDLFYDSVPKRMLCCNVRKLRPLAIRMHGMAAYFTGLRREQGGERTGIEEIDRHGSQVKISPLADWTAEDVAHYTVQRALPVHELYSQGYASIGCDPCTRAVSAGESERAGRWWWESEADKECGIHFTPDGRAVRIVDVLLEDLLTRKTAA